MDNDATLFYKKLIPWYLENKRDLPWRNTQNPYFIWISEIILQQTRVAQGLPYYLKFVKRFPNIELLALAPEPEVLKLWQGLGYYSRARNLHATAQYISSELHGVFPKSYPELLKLKGVGHYTASAIASICYNLPTAVVDGNVFRVLARVFGISTPINSAAGIREFKLLARQLMDVSQPAACNQAIMEFGARYCVPKNPDCGNCIFNKTCIAFKTGTVPNLPVKSNRNPIKKRYFNYMVLLSENNETFLRQRKGKGIWRNLYEFPLIETDNEISLNGLLKTKAFKTFASELKGHAISLYNEKSICHKLSHQHLYVRFWVVDGFPLKEKAVPFSRINEYAVPVLVENFVSEFPAFQIKKGLDSNYNP